MIVIPSAYVPAIIVGAIILSIIWGLATNIEKNIHDLVVRLYLIVPRSRWRRSVFRLYVTNSTLLEATLNILHFGGVAIAATIGYLLEGQLGAIVGLFIGFLNLYHVGGYRNGLLLKKRIKTRRAKLNEAAADPQSQLQADLTVLQAEMCHFKDPVLFFKKFVDFLLGPAGRSRQSVEKLLRMYAEKEVEIEASHEDGCRDEGLADVLATAAQEQLKERFEVEG